MIKKVFFVAALSCGSVALPKYIRWSIATPQ